MPGFLPAVGTACNDAPLATVDDGSCLWFGCTDPTAINYAINYGGNFPPEAQSYDNDLGNPPNAGIVDDNSCIYPAYGCTDPMMYNYDPNATAACDATGLAAGNNECCIPFVYGCLGQNDTFGNMILAEDAGNYGGPNNSNNVIPPVNTDDGSCQWDFCLNALDVNNEDSNWSQDMIDQSVNYTVISPGYINFNDCADGGCTDATAYNYDASATWDDGSCIPVSFNCYMPGFPCVDPGDGSGTYATQNDCNNNCVAALPGCTYGGNPLPGWFTVMGDGGPNTSDTWSQLYGISDPGAQASNYSAAATEDNGSCQWIGADVYGCADPTAGDYPDINDNGSDNLPCTWPCANGYAAVNFDPGATINDGSCIVCAEGQNTSVVTQPSAPGATDGSIVITITLQYPMTGLNNQFAISGGAPNSIGPWTNGNQTVQMTWLNIGEIGPFTIEIFDVDNFPGGLPNT